MTPKAQAHRTYPDSKKLVELGQLEATLIHGNFRSEDRISVNNFDDHLKMSNVIQKIKFVAEQLGDSMMTKLINSVFLTAHSIIEMAMVLGTYVDPPLHLAGHEHALWSSLADQWGNHRVMSSFKWNLPRVNSI